MEGLSAIRVRVIVSTGTVSNKKDPTKWDASSMLREGESSRSSMSSQRCPANDGGVVDSNPHVGQLSVGVSEVCL